MNDYLFLVYLSYNIFLIKGTNFCKSGKDAFNLLMRNIARVVVLNCVVGFVLFIGKLGKYCYIIHNHVDQKI